MSENFDEMWDEWEDAVGLERSYHLRILEFLMENDDEPNFVSRIDNDVGDGFSVDEIPEGLDSEAVRLMAAKRLAREEKTKAVLEHLVFDGYIEKLSIPKNFIKEVSGSAIFGEPGSDREAMTEFNEESFALYRITDAGRERLVKQSE